MSAVQCTATHSEVAPQTVPGMSSRIGAWKDSEVQSLGKSERLAFGKILSRKLGPRRREALPARLIRARKILGLDLHRRVLTRMCCLEFDELKRLTNFVESVRDCLAFSTPAIDPGSADFKRVLKWAYSIGAYRTDSGTAQWKRFSSLLKWKAFQSNTPKPDLPCDFPGFGDQYGGDLPPLWSRLCPWMVSIFEHGAKTKLDLSRVTHFTSSRGFPPGDAKTRALSLQKHKETLSSRCPIDETRTALLFELSRLIGAKLRVGTDYQSNAHLSLTTSSSFDSTVKEGGRAKEISEKFRSWMEAVPARTVEGTTLLGRDSTELCGFPRWMTCGRKDYWEFLSNLPRDADGSIHPCVQAGESRQDTVFDFENFKYEDPIFALDDATGYQLHQWAVEELLVLGILTGDKHDPKSIRVGPGMHPLVRRSCIGEPGAKSRVITVAEACITIFLQPYSHHLSGWLRIHPSARAGFTRAAQGFEYVKALHLKEHPSSEGIDLWILSSDLSTATDFCVHEYSQAMLDGFCTGIGNFLPYHRISNKLLCSPRQVVEDGVAWPTARGILMGDPGAKVVLTLHNLCAELEAFVRWRIDKDVSNAELLRRTKRMQEIPAAWWRHFACSGDDHAAVGPQSYLQGITRAHSMNGMCVSWPQNFVSKLGGVYCEESFFTRGYSSRDLFQGKYLYQLGYGIHIHVDAVKLRLLSPCSKEHEGKDEPNPGIGKAHQISKVLTWLEPPLDALKKRVSWRFVDRFSSLLPNTIHTFLPVSLGGLQAPGWHLRHERLLEEIIDLPAPHLTMIEKVLSGKSTHLDRRVISSLASNSRLRGIVADLIQDQIREFLSNTALTNAINVDEIQSLIEVAPEEFLSWNARKKFSVAATKGFISISDAINLIERPYIFRNLLFPDMSEKHGIVPQNSAAYSNFCWNLRIRRFNEYVNRQVPEGEDIPLSLSHLSSLTESVVEGRLLEVPPSNLLIPKDVVQVESRPQLRTPYRCCD